jgi:hypothetical protein
MNTQKKEDNIALTLSLLWLDCYRHSDETETVHYGLPCSAKHTEYSKINFFNLRNSTARKGILVNGLDNFKNFYRIYRVWITIKYHSHPNILVVNANFVVVSCIKVGPSFYSPIGKHVFLYLWS